MRYRMKVSVSNEPEKTRVFKCKRISMREKLLRWLFGSERKMLLLVPSDSVNTVTVTEEADETDEEE